MSNNGREIASLNRVFVGGISWKADESSLANFFSAYGTVVECKIIMDKVTGKSKGYGFVTFQDAESANNVKQSTNLYFLGKTMNVGDAVRKNDALGVQQSSSHGGSPRAMQIASQQLSYQVPYGFTPGYNAYYYPQQQGYFANIPQYAMHVYPQSYNSVYGQQQFQMIDTQGTPFPQGVQGWQPIPSTLYPTESESPSSSQDLNSISQTTFSPTPLSTHIPPAYQPFQQPTK